MAVVRALPQTMDLKGHSTVDEKRYTTDIGAYMRARERIASDAFSGSAILSSSTMALTIASELAFLPSSSDSQLSRCLYLVPGKAQAPSPIHDIEYP